MVNDKNLESEPGLVLTLSGWYKIKTNLDTTQFLFYKPSLPWNQPLKSLHLFHFHPSSPHYTLYINSA